MTPNTPFDFMELAGLQLWQREQEGDNSQRRARLRKNLAHLMENEMTPRQKQILEMFFFRQMRVTDIAEEIGLSKSCVSRTLKRSLHKLYHFLQYTY